MTIKRTSAENDGEVRVGEGGGDPAEENVGLYGHSLDTEQMFQGTNGWVWGHEDEELGHIRGGTRQFGGDIYMSCCARGTPGCES